VPRRVCLILALIASAAPARQADTPRPVTITLAEDAESRWVPFTLTPGNQIRFVMTVDGRRAVAILDTGVSYSLVARTSPLAAGPVRPGGNATAIGGTVPIGWLSTNHLTIGGLLRTGGELAVAALPAVATGGDEAIDVLVGRDLTGGQALDIDHARRRFRLIRSGRLPFRGITAPLWLSPERQVYETEVVLGGVRLKPMVIDTGDGSAITVTEAGWAMAFPSRAPVTSALSYGLAGPLVTGLSIVSDLTIGELAVAQAEVRVEPAGGLSQAIGAAGRIGSGFLQGYRVLLDPGAGRMVLATGPSGVAPPLRSTSGLLLGITPDRLRVLHVMRGSPAEAAGWREGDTICAIDGQPVGPGYATSALATWSVGEPGRRVALTDCERRVRVLTLRRFY
jgi:hypothetical protein